MRGGLNNPSPQIIPNMPVLPGLHARAMDRITGLYYSFFGTLSFQPAHPVLAANYIYAAPFYVFKTETFDRISTHVQTAAAGSLRLGVYKDNNLKPGALLFDAGAEIDTSTTGSKEITINKTIEPGLYWLAMISNATPTIWGVSIDNLFGLGSGLTGWGTTSIYKTSQAYGELPAASPTPAISGNIMPFIALRRA